MFNEFPQATQRPTVSIELQRFAPDSVNRHRIKHLSVSSYSYTA
jgi:hypothetical protein